MVIFLEKAITFRVPFSHCFGLFLPMIYSCPFDYNWKVFAVLQLLDMSTFDLTFSVGADQSKNQLGAT